MISLIICSRNATISNDLQKNIEATIGADYEMVVIDNANHNLSIFEAYNLGVSKSCGDILCFMHDDILFHTKNWGEKVNIHFETKDTGAIGVAGSPYVPQTIGSWWANELVNQQIIGNDDGVITKATKYSDSVEEIIKPVISLDGVWMCINKEVFNKIAFDHNTFTGYHFYDIDICLQIVELNYKIYTVFDIEIEHFSAGKVNEQWIKNAFLFNKKWSNYLPKQAIDLTQKQKLLSEVKTLKEFVNILIANNHLPSKCYIFAIKQLLKSNKSISTLNKFYFNFYYLIKYINSKLHSN